MSIPKLAIPLVLATAVLVTTAAAEISKVPPSGAAELVPVGNKLRVQCFQQGAKIVDEEQLEAMNVSPSSRVDSLTFRRRGQEGAALTILTLAETTCVVASQR